MRSNTIVSGLALLALGVLTLTVFPVQHRVADKLKIEGLDDGASAVVMLQMRTDSNCRDQSPRPLVFRYVGSADGHPLQDLHLRAQCISEIAVFSEKHAMLFQTIDKWPVDVDAHTVRLEPRIEVPLTIWVTSQADLEEFAKNDLDVLEAIYAKNRVGVQFIRDIRPVWHDSDAVTLIKSAIDLDDPRFPQGRCVNLSELQRSDWYNRDTLNVYYTGRPFGGRNCAISETPTPEVCRGADYVAGDGNITLMGRLTDPSVLAHEIAHALGLRPGPCGGHTTGRTGFTENNVMWEGVEGRAHFSLGQVFRMNTHHDIWGGTMLVKNKQRKEPVRACPADEPKPGCPPLELDWPNETEAQTFAGK
jgi:hypothetical protein